MPLGICMSVTHDPMRFQLLGGVGGKGRYEPYVDYDSKLQCISLCAWNYWEKTHNA